MNVKLGVVMDPIDSIKPYKDTTFAMLLAAEKRGWELFYLEQADLSIRDGQALGHMRSLQVMDQKSDWFSLDDSYERPLSDLDVILMRKDPPLDLEYIYATQILELAESEGVLVVNKPQSLRDCNEKLFATLFPECCPPTLVSSDADQLNFFISQHRDVILKPLDGMGGMGVHLVHHGESEKDSVISDLTHDGTRHIMAQRFIPEIKDGDKRILLINGEPVPYALARIPAEGEVKANLAAGGTGVGVELSVRDQEICRIVGPKLIEKGLLFVGIDVIGDYLTEINVTSPTCIRELDHAYDLDIASQLMDVILAKLKK